MKDRDAIPAIELKMQLHAAPAAAYRAVTSQTELRKWFAPRVIMSRNIVSQEHGIDVTMKQLKAAANQMVRYRWTRDVDPVQDTVITFEISDKGAARSNTGEGITLTVSHDGWTDRAIRDRQAEIWSQAFQSLGALLKGKSFKPWWEESSHKSNVRHLKFPALVAAVDRMEKESKRRSEKKTLWKTIKRIVSNLEGAGEWYFLEEEQEIEFHVNERRFMTIQKTGHITIYWKELEKIAGNHTADFINRLALEQGVDVHPARGSDRWSGLEIIPDALTQWFLDLIRHGKTRS